MLRLYPATKQTDWHRELADQFIDRLEPHIGGDGRLPVWLVDDADHGLLGEGCGAIEANVLRGLLAYDEERLGPMVDRSTTRLLTDFDERGTSITVNYPRPYLLAVLAALLADLERLGSAAPVSRGWKRLSDEIDREARRDRPTPMTAALLILACDTNPAAAVDPQWETVVREGQQADGGWIGEPIFFVPKGDRGVAWHRSRLVTSAICYDALVTSKGSA